MGGAFEYPCRFSCFHPRGLFRTSIDACVQIHEKKKYNKQGDVLCFVAGQDDVLQITRELHDYARRLSDERKKLIILPLNANLKFIDQVKVFQKTPPNTRKIIVATTIAETSITIPGTLFLFFCVALRFCVRLGIVYVIECGYIRRLCNELVECVRAKSIAFIRSLSTKR